MALVLLVDDEEAISSVAGLLLELHGHEVLVAADGAEALRTAGQRPPDVIITDLMMPVMDGLALCNAVQRDPRLRHIPIVLMSAAPIALEQAQCHARGRLRKPFEADELYAAVDAALGSATPAKELG
jgi:CheY-like chemotaxis protein